jgi:hypothetical protein
MVRPVAGFFIASFAACLIGAFEAAALRPRALAGLVADDLGFGAISSLKVKGFFGHHQEIVLSRGRALGHTSPLATEFCSRAWVGGNGGETPEITLKFIFTGQYFRISMLQKTSIHCTKSVTTHSAPGKKTMKKPLTQPIAKEKPPAVRKGAIGCSRSC